MSKEIIEIKFGDVSKKSILTTNHFVSHMIEHIAWRMGLSIQLSWPDQDWHRLGEALGKEIQKFTPIKTSASALGMIDDGSAIVEMNLGHSNLTLQSVAGINLEWFLSLRCEQIENGQALVDLLNGLCLGLQAEIKITIWTVEDPHHTWEGIFRGIGISLFEIYAEEKKIQSLNEEIAKDNLIERQNSSLEIVVLEKSANLAKVRRGTAETGITILLDFNSPASVKLNLDIDTSLQDATRNLDQLLLIFAKALNIKLEIDFKAIMLSSSHVVCEDIGLVLGRALLEVLKIRMHKYGINAAGSSIQTSKNSLSPVVAAINIEGRKFWRFVPVDGDFIALKKSLLIGQNILTYLRSEDLDDFVDGLAGGLSASIMIQVHSTEDPNHTWQLIFAKLGNALSVAFEANPYRKGVPAGVKATLA